MGATDGQRNWPEMRKTLGKPGFLSGEGGIRTRGTMLLVRRFSKPVLSATQPPLRIFKSTKKYTLTQED